MGNHHAMSTNDAEADNANEPKDDYWIAELSTMLGMDAWQGITSSHTSFSSSCALTPEIIVRSLDLLETKCKRELENDEWEASIRTSSFALLLIKSKAAGMVRRNSGLGAPSSHSPGLRRNSGLGVLNPSALAVVITTNRINKWRTEFSLTRSLCHQRVGLLYPALEDCFSIKGNLSPTLREDTSRAAVQIQSCIKAKDTETELNSLNIQIKKSSSNGPAIAQLLKKRALLLTNKRGDYVGAVRDLKEALKLHPSALDKEDEPLLTALRVGDDLQEMVTLFMQQKNYVRLRTIAQKSPRESVRAFVWDCLDDEMNKHRLQGMHHFCARQYQPAVMELTKAIAILKQVNLNTVISSRTDCSRVGAVLHSSRASCFIALGEFEFALHDSAAAIAFNMSHVQAWLNQCICLEALGDNAGYLKTVSQAVQTFGHSNALIAELMVKAMSTKAVESSDAEVITADDVFS